MTECEYCGHSEHDHHPSEYIDLESGARETMQWLQRVDISCSVDGCKCQH